MVTDPQFGLGIDPGLRACGLAIVARGPDGWSLCTAQTVKTSAKEGLVVRLRRIHDALSELLQPEQFAGHLIDWVAIEDPLHVIAGKSSRKETNFEALRLLVVLGLGCAWSFELSGRLALPEPGEVKRAVAAARSASPERVIRCVRAIVKGCPANLDEHQAHAVGAAIAGARMLQIDAAIAKARKRS